MGKVAMVYKYESCPLPIKTKIKFLGWKLNEISALEEIPSPPPHPQVPVYLVPLSCTNNHTNTYLRCFSIDDQKFSYAKVGEMNNKFRRIIQIFKISVLFVQKEKIKPPNLSIETHTLYLFSIYWDTLIRLWRLMKLYCDFTP